MSTIVARPRTHVERRRRVHAKSRKGCVNCKLRRVKCDELRPHCKKCRLYGVDCNYGGSETTLQISAQGSFQFDFTPLGPVEQVIDLSATIPQDWSRVETSQATAKLTGSGVFPLTSPHDSNTSPRRANDQDCPSQAISSQIGVIEPTFPLGLSLAPISINSTITAIIDNSMQLSFSAEALQPTPKSSPGSAVPFWHFSESHLQILARFRDRTALTIGDKQMASAYRDCICHLAMTHAFLMHMLLGLTLMHDADLTIHIPYLSTRHKHSALTHWNTATKLFNRVLSRPIPPAHRDAVWATGVIIGAASFWFVNSSSNPYEVWPLKPYETEDLAWLRLSEGKRILWKIADPTRPESMFFQLMRNKKIQCHSVLEWLNISDTAMRIPAPAKRIFGIGKGSTIQNNPYHLPLLILSKIQHMHLTHANVVSFLYVTAFITPELFALLEAKDPRAVFILGWWFKMIEDGELWWMVSRARIEGQAIHIWLEREDRYWGLARLLGELNWKNRDGDAEEMLGLPARIWSHDWKGDGGDCAKQMAYWEVEPVK